MSTARPGGSRPQSPRARPGAGLALWLPAALPLVLALLVHRRALGAFFSTDDFVRLEEAAGLLPAIPTLWRLVSEVLYVKLMLGLFGPRPLPFHIVSLALHLVNTAFVFRLGRRAGLSAGAACFASAIFGAFPLFHTVLLSAVNINDILALTFVFLALLALETPTPARTGAAIVCFVIAFLSKEAVLFLPFAAVLLPLGGERPAAAARRLLPLLATGVALTALYLLFRKHGIGTGGSAYAVGIGMNLVHNLMTYSWWSVDLVRAVPDLHGLLDATAWRVGMWPLVVFAVAIALSRSRRGTILFGCAWWLAGLAPVLPLVSHTYGHYLYMPMAGFAVASAAVVDALAEGLARLTGRAARPPAPHAWVAFALLAIAFSVRSEFLLRERVSVRLGSTQLARDPFTRKMEVARLAVSTLSGQLDRARDTVVVFTPPGLGKPISVNTGREVESVPAGVPYYDVVEGVLGGGIALRLFEPRLDSVVFTGRWTREYRDFTLFTEGPGGSLVMMGRGPRSHSRLAGLLIGGAYHAQARDYLAEVVHLYPDDRLNRLLYAVALSGAGDLDSARSHARLLIDGAAPDTITATARKLLSILDTKK